MSQGHQDFRARRDNKVKRSVQMVSISSNVAFVLEMHFTFSSCSEQLCSTHWRRKKRKSVFNKSEKELSLLSTGTNGGQR